MSHKVHADKENLKGYIPTSMVLSFVCKQVEDEPSQHSVVSVHG